MAARYELVVDVLFVIIWGARTGVSRLAVEADVGAVGSFPEKE